MSYQAIVCSITTRPHPDAQRILIGTACGHQVIVGTNTKDGDMGIFLPPDGQLSEEMCKANDLIGYTDEQGNKKGGFFAANRRVRAQSFRGVKSEGFWIPLDSLSWPKYNLSKLREGECFDTLNGHPICNKYYTPATLRAMKPQGLKKKLKFQVIMPEHVGTAQFKYHVSNIPLNSTIYITEKLHGTSGRYGYVPVSPVLTGWKSKAHKILDWLRQRLVGNNTPSKNIFYNYFNGTRRVILSNDRSKQIGYYGDDSFRSDLTKGITLHKGEVLYFEIVGFIPTGRPIMGIHDIQRRTPNTGTENTNSRDLYKTYGPKMVYRYGAADNTCKMFVYRITMLNEDGVETDLSWPQVQHRCKQLGLVYVPSIATRCFDENYPETALGSFVESLVEGPSFLDPSHIKEGVVLRIESDQGIQFLKH